MIWHPCPTKISAISCAVTAPEPDAKVEDHATEIATEHGPTQIDVESQVGAEDSKASVASAAGMDAEHEAEAAEAKSEGLTAEQSAEIQEWQKNIVLLISEAKTYLTEARRDRTAGEVVVRFKLDRYGAVTLAKVSDSSGWQVLDAAAVETVRTIGKMPTPPNYLEGEEFTFLIPLRYRFR